MQMCQANFLFNAAPVPPSSDGDLVEQRKTKVELIVVINSDCRKCADFSPEMRPKRMCSNTKNIIVQWAEFMGISLDSKYVDLH